MNEMKRLWLLLMIAGLATTAFCQNNESSENEFSSIEIFKDTNAGGILGASTFSTTFFPFYYKGLGLAYSKTIIIENGKPENSITTGLIFQYNNPVNVIYSLYTYKKTFAQDGKRNYIQGIDEPGLVKPLTTQSDIDNDLDKIYEFPVVSEPAS